MAQRPKVFSRKAKETMELLGLMVRSARLKKGMTAAELAERAGVSRPLLARVESGEMGVAIGSVLEIAAIVDVPLIEADPRCMDIRLQAERRANALLPKRVHTGYTPELNDNF
jgi:transcriptional regulator with XRE-family HTH domain